MPRSPAAKPATPSAARVSPAKQGATRARLPHERDESADAQQPSPDRIGELAHADATGKQADTSLGPVTDRVYRKLKSR